MTNPEAPSNATIAAAEAMRDAFSAGKDDYGVASAAVAAALPHLRVQETPARPVCSNCEGEHFTCGACGVVVDAMPAPHPQPVVDREALEKVLMRHQMHYAYGDDAACLCKWRPSAPRVWQAEHREHVAERILALLPTEEGEGETTHLIADGEAVTSCCGRTPFELPRTDRITVDPSLAGGCDEWVATATRLGHRLGYELGRKEALTEAEAAIDAKEVWYREMHQPYTADGCSSAAMVVREMASQPSGATTGEETP